MKINKNIKYYQGGRNLKRSVDKSNFQDHKEPGQRVFVGVTRMKDCFNSDRLGGTGRCGDLGEV